MKYFIKGIAYLSLTLGIAAFVTALVLLFKYDRTVLLIPAGVWKNPPFEFQTPFTELYLAFSAGMLGMILNGLGILGAKPRYLWIGWLVIGICFSVLITTGLVYAAVMQPSQRAGIWDYARGLLSLLLFALPGIVTIILSFRIRKPRAAIEC